MKRRNFIQSGSLGMAGIMLGKMPVWALDHHDLDTPEDNILVVIQLFGGNDGLNTVIPADNDLYYSRFRKRIGIRKEKASRLGNTHSYLHPALSKGIGGGLNGLFKNGNLAVIQGVGYPNPDLSHFRSTDIWLSGTVPENETNVISQGWGGRLMDRFQYAGKEEHPVSINVGYSGSLLFHGDDHDHGIAIQNPEEFYERGKDIFSGDSLLPETSAYAREHNFLLDLSVISNRYSIVVKSAFDAGKNTLEYPSMQLAEELKLVCRLISGGLKSKIYLVSLDGFDTHSSQGGEEGEHAALLQEISESVSCFMADLKAQNLGKKVVGMTVSEFGRRPEDNDSEGTDHGAASAMFVFGEEVNGKVYGNAFDFNNLNYNEDFNHQFDFRQVYDELFDRWFGVNDEITKAVLGDRFGLIEEGIFADKKQVLSVSKSEVRPIAYPNPTSDGRVMLRLQTDGITPVSVNLLDVSGRQTLLVPPVKLPKGSHEIPLNLPQSSGMLILKVMLNNTVEHLKVVSN